MEAEKDKNMNQELPVTMVGKHEYQVDFRLGEFKNTKDPSNMLAMHEMTSKNNRFVFWYDNAARRIVSEPTGNVKPESVQKITIPIQALDPKFFKDTQEEAKEAMTFIKDGKSIHLQSGGIHAATSIDGSGPRLLPIVKLYDTDFFLDLKLYEFRQVDNPDNRIPWNALEPDDFHYMMWFDITAKNRFLGTLEQARKRDDVRILVLKPLDIMIREGITKHETKLAKGLDGYAHQQSKKRRKGKGI